MNDRSEGKDTHRVRGGTDTSGADTREGHGRPRRWLRRSPLLKAMLGFFIGLLAVVIIGLAFALFFSGPLIQRYALPYGSAALAESGFSISAGWVEGHPISGVTMGDFEIVHTGADGDSVTVFRADTLVVRYKLSRFLRKEWRIDSVRIANPEILLIRPPEGGVLLPGLKGTKKPSARGGGPTVDIRRIDLANALLRISTVGGEEIFEDMNLTCSYLRDPWSTKIGLKKASFVMPGRNFNVSYTSADLTLKQGVLYMEEGVVDLLSSAITFSGNISFRDRVRYDIDCSGGPYDAPELAAILKQRWPDGLLEGEASVYGPADSLAITALVGGTIERFTLKDIDVECIRKSTGFTFSKIVGSVNGASLDATGRLGGGMLTFDIDFTGLDASSGFFPGVAFPGTDLSGWAKVYHPHLRSPWEVDAAMTDGHISGFEFASLYFTGAVDENAVTMDSVYVGRPEMDAYATGLIGLGEGGEMAVAFTASLDSIDYAADWLGAEDLHGTLDAVGSLSGPSADPVLEAAGPLGWVGRGPARMDGGSFKATVHGLADPVPIDFTLSGGDVTLASLPLGALELQGEYDNDVLEVPSFRLVKGDSSASGSFLLSGGDGDVISEFDRFDVAVNGLKWTADHPFTFSYESGAYSLQGLRVFSGGGALAVSGRLDRRREHIELNAAATGMRMSSVRFPGGEVRGGAASGEVSLRGPLSGPSGMASVSWSGARAFDRDVREMALKCDIDSEGLSIERLWIDFAAGTALITGRADFALDIAEILNGGGVEFLNKAAGSPLDLSVSVTELDLGWLGRVASVEPDIGGALSISGAVRGSLERPILDVDVRADSLGSGGLFADSFSGTIEYADGALRASRAQLARGEVTAHLEGYLPVSIGLSRGVHLLSDEPMAVDVEVTPGDFAVAAEVWDRLARSSGEFSLDATVTGTPSSPELSGAGWLRNCAIRLAGMEEEYREIHCKYTLKGDRVDVTDITGRTGKKGAFSGYGEVALSWPGVIDYNFDVTFSQMAVLTPLDYDAIVSGELIITAVPLENGRLIPQIAGRVVVDEASYTGRIGGAAELTNEAVLAGTVTPIWLADLEMEIPGNAKVLNPDADLVLAGDIILIKDFDGVKPRGDLRVVSGKYYLVNTEFTVTSGTISFGEAIGVNPDLDITAETVLGSDQTGLEEKIYVYLTGTARDPRIRVSSTSGYSETDIYNMLLAGTLWGQGPQEPGGPDISALATNTLFNAIDARLRDLFGTRPPVTIGLTREQTTAEGLATPETRFSVGRNLSSRVFLQYEQGFSAITRREVNLDYRVNRYLLLRSQIINNPEMGVREESSSEINFDLKLRYEF